MIFTKQNVYALRMGCFESYIFVLSFFGHFIAGYVYICFINNGGQKM